MENIAAQAANSMKVYLDIFMAFFRANIFGFGGGPSAIPLLRQEVVDRYQWLTIEEFTDMLAFGNSLPGPIATKLSAMIGYKVEGWTGAIVATLAAVVPTAVAAILLLKVYYQYKDTPWMVGMMKGVRPVVVVLLAQVALDMGRKSFPQYQTYIIAGITALALGFFNVHPAVLIVIALVYGGIFLV